MLNAKALLTKIQKYIYGDTDRIELANGVYYRKRSGIIQVDIYNTFTLSASWTTIGTLPVGYRPLHATYFTATTVTNNGNIIGAINDEGKVTLRLVNGAGQGTYSVEACMSFMGGVVNKLLQAISNLIREEVVVC